MTIKPLYSFILVVLISAFPLFAHLDSIPFQEWDEARVAVSALEMTHDHDLIVTHYNGAPDMWSTKPPLAIWLIAGMYKAFGYGELQSRLPGAIAAFFTGLLLWWLFTRKVKDSITGLVTPIVLVTIPGYLSIHTERTADYDSILTFFTTAACCCYYLYLEETQRKHMLLFFLAMIGAALTKGVQGMIFIVPMVVFALATKKLWFLLRRWELYAGFAFFVITVGGYYMLREHYNPGYLKAVWENELGGRYSTVIESHTGGPFNYFWMIISSHVSNWYVLILPGIIIGMASGDDVRKRASLFAATMGIGYLVILSSAQTQIDWYMMPAYPFLAVLIGICISAMFRFVSERLAGGRYRWAPATLLFTVLFLPYLSICAYVLSNEVSPNTWQPHRDAASFLKAVLHHERQLDAKVVKESDNQSIVWYERALSFENRPLQFVDARHMEPGDKVLAYAYDTKDFIRDNYTFERIDTFKTVDIYKITGRKEKKDTATVAAH